MASTPTYKKRINQLRLLALLLFLGVGAALYFFIDDRPSWDKHGSERFGHWVVASVAGLVLLFGNLVSWRKVLQEKIKGSRSRIWPVAYGLAALLLIAPWLYFGIRGTSAYAVRIENRSQSLITEVRVHGTNFALGGQSGGRVPALGTGDQFGIRTKFPANAVFSWQPTPTKQGELMPPAREAKLPARPDGSSSLLILVNKDGAEATWR